MIKKIVTAILSVIMCFSVFTGCTLWEYNGEKDMQQVVATIDPIEYSEDGKVLFKSEKKEVYKYDLVSQINNYAESYISYYGYSLEDTVKLLLNRLVTSELLQIEAERLMALGKIDWTQKQENAKMRYIYNAIDSQLATARKNILSNFGDDSSLSFGEESSDASTTYPTPPAEDGEKIDYSDYDLDEWGNIRYEKKQKKDENGNLVFDGETPVYEQEQAVDARGNLMFDDDGNPIMKDKEVPIYKQWAPDRSRWPGYYGTDDERSLDRNAMYSVINTLKSSVKNDFRATKEDKAKFDDAARQIDKVINEEGIEKVYPMLGGTYYLEYLVGKSARQSIMLDLLQDYIVDTATVTEDEVLRTYNTQLTAQINAYKDNQDAFQTAVSGSNSNIPLLYLRDNSYFFVKHILLPFSDAQTAYLKKYQSDPKTAGKDYTLIRDGQMVAETVVYEHVDGEDDKSNPKTVEEVFNEVYTAMYALRNDPRLAERKFDELIYKYNTDPGAFGHGKMYAVKDNDYENEQYSGYMKEFYFGAMELHDDYKVGDVLPKFVVTDYGVHIMYYAMEFEPGYIRKLDDYLTPGAYEKVRDAFESTIKNTKEESAFNSWANDRITYYQNNEKVVHKYEKRYKDLWKTK